MMSGARRAGRVLLGFACALSLVGCLGGGPVPPDRFYMLPRVTPERPLPAPLVAGTLGVDRLRADGLREERAMLYIDSAHPLQVRRYHYHHWAAVPGELIQQNLIDYLRAARAAPRVMRGAPDLSVKARVTGRVLRLERIVGEDGVRVDVTLELYLSPASSSWESARAPGVGGDYHASVAASDRTMHATVEAYGRALDTIYARFIRDAAAATVERPGKTARGD